MDARRDFLIRHVAAGLALAMPTLAAQTAILTGTKSLEAGAVTISTSDGRSMPAYRAMPARGRNYACVLVVEEIFGVQEYTRDVCRRLAKLGYCAIAPELFFRHSDGTKSVSSPEIAGRVVSKVGDVQVFRDLDATLGWADSHGRINPSRVAITGFCWGGRITWLYAAHQPRLKAAAAWYGVLSRGVSGLQPRNPIDIAPILKAPVLGLYAAQDRWIPVETVEKMRRELKKGISGSRIEIYPDAPHGFHADSRESYRRAAAEDAWARVLAWFRRHEVA